MTPHWPHRTLGKRDRPALLFLHGFMGSAQDWEPVARAHGERFGAILPANTLVRADLIGDGYLVEIEAEADVPA